MRVLVTGGNGFLGSHLVQGLKRRGDWVRVLALTGTDRSSVQGVADDIVEGNVCKLETLLPAMEGIEVVFHLAAVVIDWGPESLFQAVNVGGTRNVLQAAVEAGCRRLVHMSSLAVHKYRPVWEGDEEWPCDAVSPAYATTKRDAEEVVRSFSKDLETVIIRPGLFPYGPGDRHNIAQILDAIRQRSFGYIDGGEAPFCVSYVDNLVSGLALAGEHPEAVGETFVLCDDETLTWKSFSKASARHLGVKPPWLSFPFLLLFPLVALWEGVYKLLSIRTAPLLTLYRLRVARTPLVFSNQKAKRMLGYEPTVSLEEGLQRTLDWYKEERSVEFSGNLGKDH
ncbi:MAG: NAD-dependent epimerase/dehydratase family protein [Deltaproteobacteria bacterium]|nr:MAG: NAD-dependent epimerase/dehydratase family protein [Deltaproteobacteria bacterium]